MGDFRLKVKADLDSKDLESKLAKIKKDKVPITVEVKGDKKIENLEKSLTKLKSLDTVKINVDVSSLKSASAELKSLSSIVKSLSKDKINIKVSDLNKQMSKVGKDVGKDFSTAMQKQIESVAKTQRNAFSEPLNNLKKSQKEYSDWWNKELGKSSNKNYGKNQQLQAFDNYLKQINEQKKRAEEIQKRFSQGFADVETSNIQKVLKNYSNSNNLNSYKSIEESYKKILSLKKEINSGLSDDGLNRTLSSSDIGNRWEQYRSALEKCTNEIKVLKNEASGISKPFNQLDSVVASNRTLSWLKNNSKAAKEYGDILTELAARQKSASSGEELQSLNKEVKQITSEAQAKGLTGKSVREEAKRAFSQITQFTGIYGAIQNIVFEVPRKAVSAVIDIDTALTNLYKVTDETDARYSQFLDNAASKSKELGRSMSSYIEQTSEWAKRGYSLNDSQELARVSSIYANVGEVDDATAVSDITTAMKAFNIEASNAESIIDSLNILGNNFATSSADLGEGLSNSASSLATARNDINQSLAMLTGMAEITQSAGEAGNALKILSMRVRGYDEETQSYSVDTEQLNGEIADLTKTAKTPGGISLFSDKDKQTYKSTYELMKDISEIYDDLSDKSQAALLEKLAGKNRGNQIAALLQAFKSGQVEKAYENSVNSEGSAQQEQDRWAQSIEARIEKFKASFQDFSRTMLSSDIFKAIISGATDLLNILTQIISVAGTLPTILGGGAIIAFIKNLDKPTITGFTIKFSYLYIASLADIKFIA